MNKDEALSRARYRYVTDAQFHYRVERIIAMLGLGPYASSVVAVALMLDDRRTPATPTRPDPGMPERRPRRPRVPTGEGAD